MKKVMTAMALGMVMVAGQASAAFYDNLPDVERNYSSGTPIVNVTSFQDNNETVELDQQAYDQFVQSSDRVYDPALYHGN